MLGQPALVARHVGGDAQREALLAEQRVAAVAGAVGPDFTGFRVMHDVLDGRVARPGDVRLAVGERGADAVDAGNEFASAAKYVKNLAAHAGHHAHVDHDVGGIGDFNADVGDRRAERAHAEGDDVHGAALHAALEQAIEGLAHLGGLFPVVGRAGVFLGGGADVGAVFDTRHIGRVGEGKEGVLALLFVELDQRASFDHFGAQAVIFFLRAISPVNTSRLGERGDFGDPFLQVFVFDVVRCIQRDGHGGVSL